MRWLTRAFHWLRRGRLDALEECHAEAWCCAEDLLLAADRGEPPSERERRRVVEALMRITRIVARERGWTG